MVKNKPDDKDIETFNKILTLKTQAWLDGNRNDVVVEYDEDLDVYTAYIDSMPHHYGEGNSSNAAIDKMMDNIKEFMDEHPGKC